MGKPFWGRAAVMGVPIHKDGRRIDQYALDLSETPTTLNRSGFSNHFVPEDILGRIDNMWYGDESGLQVILFDGEWVGQWEEYDFLEMYPLIKYPSIYVSDLAQETTNDDGTMVTGGRVRSMNLVETPAWDGLFIRSEPLPENLQKRGRL